MIRTLFAVLIITLFSTPVFAENGEVDGSAENVADSDGNSDWEIYNHAELGFVEAAVPGKITYGDKQTFAFFHGRCTSVEHLFSVYTMQPNEFKKLEGKVIVVEFNGEKIGAKILTTMKAMSGHSVMLTFGVYDKDVLLRFLQKSKKISMKTG